jgi:hypothetical protein
MSILSFGGKDVNKFQKNLRVWARHCPCGSGINLTKMKTNTATNDQWWTTLSSGEKDLISALMRMVQGAKHSEIIEVSRAARKWESGLTFFFKSRLKNQRWRRIYLPGPRATKPAHLSRAASCPSDRRSQQCAAPSRH